MYLLQANFEYFDYLQDVKYMNEEKKSSSVGMDERNITDVDVERSKLRRLRKMYRK